MLSPKLSVIIPVYNVEKYLAETIESVINQPCRDMEIILIDDGSPDNSGKICDEYAQKDDRITVIHKENGGVSSARNAGLDAASGEYIFFLDSDDPCVEGIYDDILYKKMNGCDIIFADFARGDENCNIVYEQKCPRIYDGDVYTIVSRLVKGYVPAVFFKHEIIIREKIRFDKRFKVGEDKLFMMQFAIHTSSYDLTERPNCIYRDNNSSLMHGKTTVKMLDEFALLIHERQKVVQTCIDRSYDERLVRYYRCILVGMLLEFFVMAAQIGLNKKSIESKIDEHGLRQYYDLIEEYNFGNAILKEIHLYFDHPSLFISKYRSKANIHGIIKRVLPKKVLASIKKRFMER